LLLPASTEVTALRLPRLLASGGRGGGRHEVHFFIIFIQQSSNRSVYMVGDEDVLVVVVELANGTTNNTYSDYSVTATTTSYLSSFTKAVGLGISIQRIF
jgi:hypothetical protein